MLNHKNIISVVSYTNAIPFLTGLQKLQLESPSIEVHKHWPSDGAHRLFSQEVSVALLPVFTEFENPSFKRITSFGITSNGKVGSVLLFSHTPIDQIKTIYLDYQSKTSVNLTKVLCSLYWKINPHFENTSPGFESMELKKDEAMLIIGDRAYKNTSKYSYIYDLGEEWQKYTQLPFVYAAWYQKSKINQELEELLSKTFAWGLSQIPKIIPSIPSEIPDLADYFSNKIGFIIGENEKKGIDLFRECCKKLNLV